MWRRVLLMTQKRTTQEWREIVGDRSGEPDSRLSAHEVEIRSLMHMADVMERLLVAIVELGEKLDRPMVFTPVTVHPPSVPTEEHGHDG
jgi:hypothetical protein